MQQNRYKISTRKVNFCSFHLALLLNPAHLLRRQQLTIWFGFTRRKYLEFGSERRSSDSTTLPPHLLNLTSVNNSFIMLRIQLYTQCPLDAQIDGHIRSRINRNLVSSMKVLSSSTQSSKKSPYKPHFSFQKPRVLYQMKQLQLYYAVCSAFTENCSISSW